MYDKHDKASNFLQISRNIQNTPYYKDKPFNRGAALVDLMMLTQHTECQEYKRGELVTYKRGHCYHPIEEFATRWGWERRRVKRFLDQLKDDGILTYKTSKRGTHIVMLKYEELQGYGTSNGISQGLENEEDEPSHGISNGWTEGLSDGQTDGTTDSLTDGKQVIRGNTSNIEREDCRNAGTDIRTVSKHEQYHEGEFGRNTRPGTARHSEKDFRTTDVSEYAKAFSEAAK